ncbi:uncharacterized protein N7511_001297 [Penicillium nucicola]|uniref:uncharacterized protein n=1 Tax=Penicillium nucicola TaxID=1850975 RepID=UPI0025454383|nr:uncharacterized protein N7511_001297 [Penicillium nucicola]KAJ5776286.1 hypothetical protein N7511_001297 [Penicillium nucicola]
MVKEAGPSGGNSSSNQPTSSVAGGTSATPTPANNVGGGSGWGDKLWLSGQNQGQGHADATDARSTMGSFLGLNDQKSRAESKYLQRAGLAGDSSRPVNDQGEPTCASEDHSFMGRKPGNEGSLPGMETIRNMTSW